MVLLVFPKKKLAWIHGLSGERETMFHVGSNPTGSIKECVVLNYPSPKGNGFTD